VAGLTLDSGALVAYEQNDNRVRAWLDKASKVGPPPVVPTVVIAEVWRGGQRSARVARLLKHCQIRDVTQEVARQAGDLMGRTTAEYGAVDAIVVVVAAERGDDVLTSDEGDLTVLADEYPNVRILRV
jgi:predicted nucleic acid-binding protein